MPRLTLLEYQAWLAKEAKNMPKPPPDAATREVEQLHGPILEWCRSQHPMPAVIHGRTDKASSVTMGAPDFVILWQGRVLLVECKTKTGKFSLEQAAWARLAKLQGFKVHVVRSMDEFRELTEERAQKTLFVVTVPWDYSRADSVVFDTRQEAEDYIANEVDPKAKHYATIQEQKL